jgi:hypothetical protein
MTMGHTSSATRTRLAAVAATACAALLLAGCGGQDDTAGEPVTGGSAEATGLAEDVEPEDRSGGGFDTTRLCDLLTKADIEAELGEFGEVGESTFDDYLDNFHTCEWPIYPGGYEVGVAFVDDLGEYSEPYKERFAQRRDALPDQGFSEAVVLEGIGDEAFLHVTHQSIYFRSGPLVLAVLFDLPVPADDPPLEQMSALARIVASRL